MRSASGISHISASVSVQGIIPFSNSSCVVLQRFEKFSGISRSHMSRRQNSSPLRLKLHQKKGVALFWGDLLIHIPLYYMSYIWRGGTNLRKEKKRKIIEKEERRGREEKKREKEERNGGGKANEKEEERKRKGREERKRKGSVRSRGRLFEQMGINRYRKEYLYFPLPSTKHCVKLLQTQLWIFAHLYRISY